MLQGDLGYSWRTRQPVSQLIAQKLPVTAQLGSMAFAIALLALVAIPLIVRRTRRHTRAMPGRRALQLAAAVAVTSARAQAETRRCEAKREGKKLRF